VPLFCQFETAQAPPAHLHLYYMCVYICVYICVYMYIFRYICECVYTHIYMCVNVCIYMYMYVYMHSYVYITKYINRFFFFFFQNQNKSSGARWGCRVSLKQLKLHLDWSYHDGFFSKLFGYVCTFSSCIYILAQVRYIYNVCRSLYIYIYIYAYMYIYRYT